MKYTKYVDNAVDYFQPLCIALKDIDLYQPLILQKYCEKDSQTDQLENEDDEEIEEGEIEKVKLINRLNVKI